MGMSGADWGWDASLAKSANSAWTSSLILICLVWVVASSSARSFIVPVMKVCQINAQQTVFYLWGLNKKTNKTDGIIRITSGRKTVLNPQCLYCGDFELKKASNDSNELESFNTVRPVW